MDEPNLVDVYDIETFRPVPYRNGDPVTSLKGAYVTHFDASGMYVVIPGDHDQSCSLGDLFIGAQNIVWARTRRIEWDELRAAHGKALG